MLTATLSLSVCMCAFIRQGCKVLAAWRSNSSSSKHSKNSAWPFAICIRDLLQCEPPTTNHRPPRTTHHAPGLLHAPTRTQFADWKTSIARHAAPSRARMTRHIHFLRGELCCHHGRSRPTHAVAVRPRWLLVSYDWRTAHVYGCMAGPTHTSVYARTRAGRHSESMPCSTASWNRTPECDVRVAYPHTAVTPRVLFSFFFKKPFFHIVGAKFVIGDVFCIPSTGKYP